MACVYSEDGSDTVTLDTFEVDDCGNIPASVQDTLTVTTTSGSNSDPKVIKISDGIIAVSYDENDACNLGAIVSTYSVDACGNLNCCDPIDTINVSGAASGFPVNIYPTKYSESDGIYVVLWLDTGEDIHMTTIIIGSDGVITDCIVEDVEVVTSNSLNGDFCYTGQGDYHVVVYEGSLDDGFAETYTIDSSGNIGCVADTFEFDAANGEHPTCSSNDAGQFIVVYEKSSSQGRLKTIDVDACGQMVEAARLTSGGNTSDTTHIIRIDETNKDKYLTVVNSAIRSYSVDGCGNITQIDFLTPITEVNDQARIALRPGLTTHVVMVGWEIGTTEFWAMTLAVEVDPPEVIELGVGAGKIGAGIRVDWDNNGTFDADEELGPDVTSLRWTRGKDPEELNTPGGTLIIEVEDPNGDYVPGESATAFDSKFTSSDVSVGKDVTANLEYDGTSHAIFRGSIASITPFRFNGEQRATLFCVDEMDRFSNIRISVPLSSTAGTSGNVTSSGMRPMGTGGESVVVGGTTGLIARILDEASFSSARALSEVGRSTMEHYWIYNTNIRDALFDLEKHERGSIFMGSSGDVTFLSSTHYTGLASSATFGPSTSLFTRMDYSMNSKDIVNRVLATVHDRATTNDRNAVIGGIPSGSVSLSNGSAVDIEVIFDKSPCRSIIVPAMTKDTTDGWAAVGAGGTTHVSNTTSGNHVSVFGRIKGASSMVLTITNNAGEDVNFQAPEITTTDDNSGSELLDVCPIKGIVMPNISVESTAVAIGSIDIYGRRNFNVDYPFFEGRSKGIDVAVNIVNNGSTADPTGIRLHMVGSDSNLVLQILSREIGDVIAVNSTHFHLATNQEYYITGLEGEIAAGGPLQTVWTLQKST